MAAPTRGEDAAAQAQSLSVRDPSQTRDSAADSVPDSAEAKRADSETTRDEAPKAAPVAPWFPRLLGLQFIGVYQNMPAFHSPYEGPNSLSFRDGRGHDVTHTYGVYLGSQLTSTLQAYLDVEMFRGKGISDGVGLGGYVNGDVIGLNDPYVARAYVRYSHPLSSETEKVERAMDQIPGDQPIGRWDIKVGKMAPTDDFDQNRYANDNRTQFQNFDFLYNTAWDYAADNRGYSYGIVAALYQPRWRLAFGVYAEPTAAGGSDFKVFETRQLGYNLELTVKPNDAGTVVRLLSYYNESRMGSYGDALAIARARSTVPSLLDVERPGGAKYGLGLNFEQPLADDGETGIFGRLGWNDGRNENWSYTEADRHASLGAQLSGVHWGRGEDCVGIAYGVNGLSTPHKDYLAAGGLGIFLGDGRLNYDLEQVFEAYYRIQVCKYVQVSPDFQFIQNPGYNSDRGPVAVYSLRLRVSW